jgi:hypothetical protein
VSGLSTCCLAGQCSLEQYCGSPIDYRDTCTGHCCGHPIGPISHTPHAHHLTPLPPSYSGLCSRRVVSPRVQIGIPASGRPVVAGSAVSVAGRGRPLVHQIESGYLAEWAEAEAPGAIAGWPAGNRRSHRSLLSVRTAPPGPFMATASVRPTSDAKMELAWDPPLSSCLLAVLGV